MGILRNIATSLQTSLPNSIRVVHQFLDLSVVVRIHVGQQKKPLYEAAFFMSIPPGYKDYGTSQLSSVPFENPEPVSLNDIVFRMEVQELGFTDKARPHRKCTRRPNDVIAFRHQEMVCSNGIFRP